jgi:hypothetical protein
MKPDNFERRYRSDEGQGIAERSLRERVSVDMLRLRGSDAGREDELRAAAKIQLLAMVGFTEEEAQMELSPVAQESVAPATALKEELSPEQMEKKWFRKFKNRFNAIPQLHEGVKFEDVENSLKADPESMRKLMALDEKGHAMNVFGEENGEFIFASAWHNYERVSAEHRNITYDLEGQKLSEKQGYKPNGNAVSIIAKIMGVKEDEASNYLADRKLHKQLINTIRVNGLAWLKTDAATRGGGLALLGDVSGVQLNGAVTHFDDGSFRAVLRVKKA